MRLKVLSFCFFVLLCGCVNQRPLEELGLITAIGYDLEEGMIKGSIIYYEFDPLHPNNTKMVTTVANTSKGIRQRENLSSSRRLVSGQLRIAIYGRDLAEQGIIPLIDTLSRDAEVGTMSYLAVSENSAQELLSSSQQTSDISNAGTYLYNLISQNVKGESLISPTLHEFLQCYYSEGRDPVLPLLGFKDNTIFITGLALFFDDKKIGELENKEMFYVKLLLDHFEEGSLEVELPIEALEEFITNSAKGLHKDSNKLYVSIDQLQSSSKIEVMDVEKLKFKIHVNINTRIQEITEDYDLGNPEALKKMEEEISKQMSIQIKNILKECQKLLTDPIGFGNYYRAKVGYDKFSKEQWRKIYPTATFDVEVHTNILRTGVMD